MAVDRSAWPEAELEVFPNEFPDRDYWIEMNCLEFTCCCPRTGQPDFAQLSIRYVPDRNCVELKSLKLFLQAFRNVGIFHENAVNHILDALTAALQPRKLEIVGRFNTRGGIQTDVRVAWPQ
jgi:7-cyano-7-deazaguanine reductase